MKKFIAVLLSASLLLMLAACGNNAGGNDSDGNKQTSSGAGELSIQTPLELLNKVWSGYAEDEKFSAIGGDSSEANTKTNEPGVYSLDDSAAVDSALGFPAASIGKIDSAASLIHMMNANTFTCGAYHVAKSEDVSEIASAIKTNIMERRWMCGFPDKLVVVTVGEYVVAFFGENEIIDTFKAKLTAAYSSAEIASEDAIQ